MLLDILNILEYKLSDLQRIKEILMTIFNNEHKIHYLNSN